MSDSPTRMRCGWCGGYEDEMADPYGACPMAIDHDPETGEPYICGPHQYRRETRDPDPQTEEQGQ